MLINLKCKRGMKTLKQKKKRKTKQYTLFPSLEWCLKVFPCVFSTLSWLDSYGQPSNLQTQHVIFGTHWKASLGHLSQPQIYGRWVQRHLMAVGKDETLISWVKKIYILRKWKHNNKSTLVIPCIWKCKNTLKWLVLTDRNTKTQMVYAHDAHSHICAWDMPFTSPPAALPTMGLYLWAL